MASKESKRSVKKDEVEEKKETKISFIPKKAITDEFMDTRLFKFLEPFIVKDKIFSHVTQMRPLNKFLIPSSSTEAFYKFYCDIVESNNKKEGKGIALISISQKPSKYQPIIYDLDLKCKLVDYLKVTKDPIDFLDTGNKNFLYTPGDLDIIIKTFQKVLKECGVNVKPWQLICAKLEKKRPYVENGIISSGIHLHFPFYWQEKENIAIQIEPRSTEELKKLISAGKIFLETPFTVESKIIDSVINKCWLMYGSMKGSKQLAYKFTGFVDSKGGSVPIEKTLKMANFEIRDPDGNPIEIPKGKEEYYLPRILSINQMENTFEEYIIDKVGGLEYIYKDKIQGIKSKTKGYTDLSSEQTLKLTTDLMNIINPARANKYDTWFNMGVVLFNIGNGCVEYLDLWIEFSKKTTEGNFNENFCYYSWEHFEKKNVTIGSLHYFAKMDNPQKWEDLNKKNADKRIKECIKGSDNDLAKMLFDRYQTTFACVNQSKKIWFRYEGHRWVKDENGRNLSMLISSELSKSFTNIAKRLYEAKLQQGMGSDDDIDEDEIIEKQKKEEKERKKIEKLIQKMKSSPGKRAIMSEASEVFYREGFEDKLDSNPDLVCFTNGVIDLKDPTLTLRPGKPEDNITLCTGYDYKEFSWDSQEVAEANDFFQKVFPRKEFRNFFFEYAAGLLRGGNIHKVFLVMSGRGNNAKSVLMDLLEKVLGKYCIKLPTSLITGARTQSSAAAPELSRSNGTRFAVVQEPSKKDKINVGLLKELTGNDSMFLRGLFQDGKEQAILFCLAMICNHLPALPADDPAAWDRVLVLLFESKFLEASKVPKSIKEQFKQKIFVKDPTFSLKSNGMRAPVMWIFMQYYKKIRDEGRSPPPQVVLDATSKYRHDNDLILKYINDRIVMEKSSEDSDNSLSITSIISDLKEWAFKDNLPKDVIPKKDELIEDLKSRWGPSEGGKWKNMRFRNGEDIEEKEELKSDDKSDDEDESKDDDKSDDKELEFDDEDFVGGLAVSSERKSNSEDEGSETD